MTAATAGAGEVIFHRAGAKVVYQAEEDAELVYVSYPALRLAPVGAFQPASQELVTQLVGAGAPQHGSPHGAAPHH